MIAFIVTPFHWVGPSLAAAAAAILILAARALPSQPTWRRTRTAPDPKLPVIDGFESGKPSAGAVVAGKGDHRSPVADQQRPVM
jgi:hypothetical protein